MITNENSLIYLILVFGLLDMFAYFRLKKEMKETCESLRSSIRYQADEIFSLKRTAMGNLREVDVRYYAEEYVNEFGGEEEDLHAEPDFDARATLPQDAKCPNPCKKTCSKPCGRKCP